MKTPWIGSAAVLLGVLVVGWHYYSHGQPSPAPSPSAHAPTPGVQGTFSVPNPEKRTVATATTVAAISPHNYQKEFQAQQDYWAYAQQLLPRAKAGDADAQFYLGKILSFCLSANRGFFEHLRQKITLDEALQLAAERYFSWPLGEAEPVHYWLSTLPQEISFKQLINNAMGRWMIERDYEELKSELGLSHYEGRNWRGFHHHATLCIAAYGFLLQRLRGKKNRAVFKEPPVPEGFRPRGSRSDAASQPLVNRERALSSGARARAHAAAAPLLRETVA